MPAARPGHPRSDGAGYEFAHVAIDDHSRIARIDILPDEKQRRAVLCRQRTVACFKSIGVRITRAMTDNGACYAPRLSPTPAATAAPCSGARGRHGTTMSWCALISFLVLYRRCLSGRRAASEKHEF